MIGIHSAFNHPVMTRLGVSVKYLSALVGILLSFSVMAATLEEGYQAVRGGELDKGFAILSELAKTGDADAQFALAILYREGWGTEKDLKTAFELYLKSAEQGHPVGMFETGLAYQSGEGVIKDYAKAVPWYEKAANVGHPAAMYALGGLYYNGMGVAKDEKQGNEWFKRSAQAGYQPAIQYLEQVNAMNP